MSVETQAYITQGALCIGPAARSEIRGRHIYRRIRVIRGLLGRSSRSNTRGQLRFCAHVALCFLMSFQIVYCVLLCARFIFIYALSYICGGFQIRFSWCWCVFMCPGVPHAPSNSEPCALSQLRPPPPPRLPRLSSCPGCTSCSSCFVLCFESFAQPVSVWLGILHASSQLASYTFMSKNAHTKRRGLQPLHEPARPVGHYSKQALITLSPTACNEA
jgi:hypothetical protein